MMIFDSFQTPADAARFATAVRVRYRRRVIYCRTREEVDQHETFPYELELPVVLVARSEGEDETEAEIETLVNEFFGKFAGT